MIEKSWNLKKIAAIGLLLLLLYNMFGLATAIIFFDDQYKLPSVVSSTDDYQLLKVYMPSLPYSADWENSEAIEGLLQNNGKFYNTTRVQHSNDTLYVTIKSNQAARDRFFELANQMESLSDPSKSPDTSHGKALKQLNNLLKNYLQNTNQYTFPEQPATRMEVLVVYSPEQTVHSSFLLSLPTPPPEKC